MRLHRLTVSAFGPFAGQEVVDFDALAAGGLFLLSGPTGAGKTSVLDAVCFALYGSVPGSRGRARSLRSDHADAQRLTEVELELTVGGRRLLVVRRPEQRRPKRRGEGSTLEKAQTLLSEWSPELGEWRARSGSHQEIGAELHELIGMSRDQFTQVVLLPQGDFARFLQAGAQERRELLGRLFDTRRFGEVESWLTEHRQRCEKEAQAVQGDIGAWVERLREASGEERPGGPYSAADALGVLRAGQPRASAVDRVPAGPSPAPAGPTPSPSSGSSGSSGSSATEIGAGPSDSESSLVWAAALRERAELRREVAEVRVALADERHAAAAEQARAVAGVFERQRRHRRAVDADAALSAQSPAHREREQRLARAERAASVAPLLRQLTEAQHAHDRARTTAQRAVAALAGPGQEPPSDRSAADNPAAELRAAEREVLGQVGELRALLDAEQRFDAVRREQAQQERQRAAAEEEREEAAAWLELEWPGLRSRAQQAAEAARGATAQREALAERLRAAEERGAAAQRRDALEARLTAARQEHLTLRGLAADAHERLLELQQRRIDGMAAELAARLEQGAPCSVCGATEHPRPAQAAPDQVTPEAERAAEARYREADRRAKTAEAELGPAADAYAAAVALAGGQALAELRHEVERLRAAHAEAEHAEAAGVTAVRRLDQLEREHERRSAVAADARTRAVASEEALTRLAAEGEALDARLAAARAGAVSVAARLTALAARAEALGRAADAVHAERSAHEAEGAARARAERECALAGFADLADAASAALPPAAARQLREAVEQYVLARDRARAELGDAELAAAAALPPVDPAAAQAAEAAAERLRLAAHSARDSASRRVADLARLGERLTADVRRLRPFAERLATATELSQLVAGTSRSNELRMSLENYVLAARLEQVAASAGLRLAAMSHGRYTLEHTDARARGNTRSGLGLQVLDAWTGQYRDTATLSGGESFFASLALALGLADVVTDEAGGMPLDTLFVDEGFGSLDADALEEVMTVLDGLRERDRAVGIVSHVAELRDRVPNQLQVRKGRSGSRLGQTR